MNIFQLNISAVWKKNLSFTGSKGLIKSTNLVWLICGLTIKSFTFHTVWLKIVLNWIQIFSSLWGICFLGNEYFGVLFSCSLLFPVYECVWVCVCVFFLLFLLLKGHFFNMWDLCSLFYFLRKEIAIYY